MTEREEKVRENRLRRMALRQDLILSKSRRRDPRAMDYGHYYLVDFNNCLKAGGDIKVGFLRNLDDVEAWLQEGNTR